MAATYFTYQKSAVHPSYGLERTTYQPIVSPQALTIDVPFSELSSATVNRARNECIEVINERDDRLIVVVGPCSIHDSIAAFDYAQSLYQLKLKYLNDLVIVMRAYFEKPRSTGIWKGLISDPDMNGSCQLNKGLKIARKLLADLNELGMPVACEILNPLSLQYLGEFISWGAIGARTAESQIHREVASGVDFPIGFKNGTNGGCTVAIDAIQCASRSHHYIGVTPQANLAITATSGNENCHIILRGGTQGPNYDVPHIQGVTKEMENRGLSARIMVDFSHGNSSREDSNQMIVSQNVASQIAEGNNAIVGVMIESNIEEGRQDISAKGVDALRYGVSVTDVCVSLPQTEIILEQLAASVRARRLNKNSITRFYNFNGL